MTWSDPTASRSRRMKAFSTWLIHGAATCARMIAGVPVPVRKRSTGVLRSYWTPPARGCQFSLGAPE